MTDISFLKKLFNKILQNFYLISFSISIIHVYYKILFCIYCDIKNQNFSSFICFLFIENKRLFAKIANQNSSWVRQVVRKKYRTIKTSSRAFSFLILECASCKKTPLWLNLLLKYSIKLENVKLLLLIILQLINPFMTEAVIIQKYVLSLEM